MNTNSNTYTVIYTTVVCVLVAAILAFVSQSLKPKQEANEKAETISQILTAAQFGEKADWQSKGNAATLAFYKENAAEARGFRIGILEGGHLALHQVFKAGFHGDVHVIFAEPLVSDYFLLAATDEEHGESQEIELFHFFIYMKCVKEKRLSVALVALTTSLSQCDSA